MAKALQDVTERDLYRAAVRGMAGAEAAGEGLVEGGGLPPLDGALATLARVRFIEQAMTLGVADMLQVSVLDVAQAADRLGLALLLHRVAAGETPLESVLALARGFGAAQLTSAAQDLYTKLRETTSMEGVCDFARHVSKSRGDAPL